MAKQFYIKSQDGQWLLMTGQAFYKFVKTEEGKQKCFFDFGEYVLEVSSKKYKEFRKEKDHSDYVSNTWKDIKIISLYSDEVSKFGSGEDVLCNGGEDIVEIIFRKKRNQALDEALTQLTDEEYQLIRDLYLLEKRKIEQQIADELNVSQKAINKRKKKILEKLKFLVLKSEKSSQ